MSDRIAVMSDGHVEQVGTPREVYEEPASAYVADFLGVSNLMDAEARGHADVGCRILIGDVEVVAKQGDTDATGPVKVVIRPERVRVEDRGERGTNRVPAMVDRSVYVGSIMQVMLRLPGGQVVQAMIPNRGDAHAYEHGTPVTLHLPPEDLRVLRAEAGGAPEEAASAEETAAGAALS